MSKPKTTLHMAISIDGRIVPTPWPEAISSKLNDVYERIHRDLGGDAWIVGRVTMAEFAKGEARPLKTGETFPRTTWKAPKASEGPYAVALDESGKLHLNRDTANDDPIVCVLTETVSDAHLAELQRDGISYLFAGSNKIDLLEALDTLRNEFGVEHLLVEGGGGINGAFLEQGLIDEISLVITPVTDGGDGPTLFTSGVVSALELTGVNRLEDGFVNLRYAVPH